MFFSLLLRGKMEHSQLRLCDLAAPQKIRTKGLPCPRRKDIKHAVRFLRFLTRPCSLIGRNERLSASCSGKSSGRPNRNARRSKPSQPSRASKRWSSTARWANKRIGSKLFLMTSSLIRPSLVLSWSNFELVNSRFGQKSCFQELPLASKISATSCKLRPKTP